MCRPTTEQLREWGRKGGKVRAAMPDFREHQRHAGRRSAAVNDMAALGHKGAIAYARKYGYATLYRKCREYRVHHPSRHERQVMDILHGLGLVEHRDYEREYEALGEGEFASVDFAFVSRCKAIEVNGRVHYDPLFDHPNYPASRAAKEAKKLERLRHAGWDVLVLDYRHLDQAEARIRQFTSGTSPVGVGQLQRGMTP